MQDCARWCRHDLAETYDVTAFRQRVEEAARAWRTHEAYEAREEFEREANILRIESRLASQLEQCFSVLTRLEAKELLECVRDAALPGATLAGDGCIAIGPAEETLKQGESPVGLGIKRRQAEAASILTWGWSVPWSLPEGFAAIVVRGPVWWDAQQNYPNYTLAWCTDRVRRPDPDDGRKPSELLSWLYRRLDNVISVDRDPDNLTGYACREQLERELVDAVRYGVLRP
jgi:hypothetical protein